MQISWNILKGLKHLCMLLDRGEYFTNIFVTLSLY